MEQEILMILKMVEDGKITAEQAAELIEAVRGKENSLDEEHKGDEHKNEGHEGEGSLNNILKDAVKLKEMIKKEIREQDIGTTIRDAVAKALAQVEEGLAGLGGFLGSHWGSSGCHFPGVEVRKDYEGRFEPGEGAIRTEFSTVNGSIRLEGWDEPGYKVTVVARMNARNADERAAHSRPKGIPWLSQEADVQNGDDAAVDAAIERFISGRALVFRARESRSQARCISFVVRLPRGFTYDLKLGSSNGGIEVKGLTCSEVEAETSNGGVKLDGLEAQRIVVATSNGGVTVRGCGGQVRCTTANGGITLIPSAVKGESHYEARTSNGGIKVIVPEGESFAYALHAVTTNGRISVELPDIVYEVNSQRIGHREVRAKSEAYGEARDRLIVEAGTSNGSITVKKGPAE